MAIGKDRTGVVNGYQIGPGVDLSSVDLTGAKLRGADLTGANLEGAILTGADLYEARLMGADLSSAYLRGANLMSANLLGANLLGANLLGAKVSYAHLKDANLEDANFKGASSEGASFEGANLEGANFEGANLNSANLTQSNLEGANFEGASMIATFAGAYLRGANLMSANLLGADLEGADLEGAKVSYADLKHANLKHANLTNANLTNAKLTGANLTDAKLTGADLTGADLADANLYGADFTSANLTGAILLVPRSARSYGAMTGPILKIGKPDSPTEAAEFKRRYPAEFERLKGDTSGRDFTESLRESLREKYRTPFDWIVTRRKYANESQRHSAEPNEIMLLNVDREDDRYTTHQRSLLEKLAEVSRRSGHPNEKPPLFTIGWVRYAQDDEHGVLLIEEVQSDVEVVRTKMKGDTEDNRQLRSAGIDPDEYAEVLDLLRPYSIRFYEDAIGLVYQEAERLGYAVELPDYEDKSGKDYIINTVTGEEKRPPKSVYTDLPRRMLLKEKRTSLVPTRAPLKGKVSYYKPNPGIPPRYRQECCCVCGEPASLMSAAGEVFCEDCF